MVGTLVLQQVKEHGHAKLLLAVACYCCVALSACAHRGQSDTASTINKIRSKTVQASILTTDTPSRKSSSRSLGKSESLIGVQFVDRDHGWVASSAGSLYRTSDRGETWTRTRVPVPTGASLASFYFGSPVSGWIVLQKYSSDALDYKANEFWIVNTRDAGQTWSSQHNGRAGQVAQLRFVENQEGWAIGRTLVEKDSLQEFPFVMHTDDQGEHWTDVSERLSSVARNDGLTDLYAPKRSEAIVTTARGRVLRTANSGESWEEVAAVEDEPDQTYFGRLGQTQEGHLWLLGGADSLEGMWGLVAKREADGSWTKYMVGPYLSDGVFLSKNEMLACGHTRPGGRPVVFGGSGEGVILRSLDGGKTWTIVYRNPKVPNINALASLNSNTLWAVGEKGFILRLEFP